jgi:acyl carrier protein
MNADVMKTEVIKAMRRVAPEADYDALLPGIAFRDQLDIDSFDFLTFIIALNEATGVDVPEADYGELASLDMAVDYLTRHQPAA